ncbi:MAG TPA: NADH-quinone oxidoreductase subunit NuoE [Anaerolineae bacterium]|nr:NADH-quinone oxidoreductase subunit NuoE [Anaerolineae bacterium]
MNELALQAIIQHYRTSEEGLVEILREASRQAGYLTPEHLAFIAKALHLPQSQVHSVASFYSLISLKPLGRHVVRFCQDAPCHVVGGRAVWEAVQAALGIGVGETTPDGRWSLLTTSCIGACSVGPVMMVDDDIHGNLTPESVRDILARYDKIGGAA